MATQTPDVVQASPGPAAKQGASTTGKAKASGKDPTTRLKELDRRDWQLFSILLLVTLLVSGCVFSFLAPSVFWGLRAITIQSRLLPQLVFGFVTLIILFNIYIIQKRREITRLRWSILEVEHEAEFNRTLALLDPLTGAYNRRMLEEVLGREMARASRHVKPLSLLLFDLDRFKEINARFGHLTGDRVLREVAVMLRDNFRAGDVVIRYGGDEFLVILTETQEAGAKVAASRFAAQLQAWGSQQDWKDFSLSASVGIAHYRDGMTVADMLDEADRLMFSTKPSRNSS